MNSNQSYQNEQITLIELNPAEIDYVAGGQVNASYCVHAPNGSVGVHDNVAMVSRPANSGECGIGNW